MTGNKELDKANKLLINIKNGSANQVLTTGAFQNQTSSWTNWVDSLTIRKIRHCYE